MQHAPSRCSERRKLVARSRSAVLAVAFAALTVVQPAKAEITSEKVQALLPGLETQVAAGMKAFSVPGVAIGIVFDDRLIYSKGFGVRTVGKADSVTPDTVFQIGSTTKAFLATSLAQAVDAGRLKWSDRVVDHVPSFQLADPWVSRDFRILDLAAQRSGLTPYVNDDLTFLGFDKQTMIRSLRVAPQTAIFRSDFGYLNIPHMVGGEVVAKLAGTSSWYESVKRTLLDPLGMSSTTATPQAIAETTDHASGHRFGERPVAIPFHPASPYAFGPAGGFNSNVTDMATWLRMQLGRGHFDGKVIVSEENLDITWTPRVAMSERASYAVGWVANATPNGRIIWHNGGTPGFGAHAGFLPDGRTGIVILTNLGGSAMADALAQWFYDRALGNPEVDNIALAAAAVQANREAQRKQAAAFIPAPLPASASALAGSYVSPVLGTATVAIVEGKLRLTLEKTDAVALLDASKDDPNLFSARIAATPGYEPIVAITGDAPFTQIRFERDGAGHIGRLRWLSPELPHVFTRQSDQ
jgi:CubicO group peptidase (beta-lactamase class C family)